MSARSPDLAPHHHGRRFTGTRIENSGSLSISLLGSLIVAASKAASCGFLLTEDLQAGQTLDGIKVINPFLTDPEDLS